MTIKSFKPKPAKAHVVLSFDMAPGLVDGETLTDLVDVSVAVNDGRDDDPYAILSPTATPGVQDKLVVVPVVDTKAGYKINVTVDTSNPNKRLSVTALLPLLAE